MRDKINDESVDLVYLDPPFNSKADYNILFKTPDNIGPSSQIIAFEDTWHWTNESERTYAQLLRADSKIASVIRGMKEAIGENDMMAYLVMMAIRLIELHRVLKPTGSLYLHCDPTASHYVKIILDAIFDPRNFQNEIVWERTGSHNSAKRWGPIHDVLLYYSKSKTKTWNRILLPHKTTYLTSSYRYNDEFGRYRLSELTGSGTRAGDSGKPWRGVDFTERGRHWAIPSRSLPDWFVYPESWSTMSVQERLDELDKQNLIDWGKDGNSLPRFKKYLRPNSGRVLQDIITDIRLVSGNEDMRYDTQKPVALLERIITASSNEGDVVLDPFCGCGTAIEAAQKLNRNWIGIDTAPFAIGLIEKRMKDAFGIRIKEVHGIPNSFESAQALAKRDKFQFEAWAVQLIPNVMPNKRQVGDRGIDGRGYIQLGKDGNGKRIDAKIIVSVKGGDHLAPSMIRDLAGTMESEGAELGVFVCLRKPTKRMKEAAAKVGTFETPLGGSYPKLQIYTISDRFNKIKPNLPSLADFVKAPRAGAESSGRQTMLT